MTRITECVTPYFIREERESQVCGFDVKQASDL